MSEQPPFPPPHPPQFGPNQPPLPGPDDTAQFGAYNPPPPGGPHDAPPFAAPEPPAGRASFLRRRRVPLIIAAAVIVLGGAGAGIAVAATSDSGSSPHAAGASTPGEGQLATGANSAQAGGKQGKKAKKGKKGKAGAQRPVRATIVSESSSTWTVKTAAGQTLTVTIGPSTQFGTRKAPASKSQFTPGKQVAVIGQRSGTGITATRIRVPQAKGSAPKTAPTPSSSPS